MNGKKILMDKLRLANGCVPRGTFRVNPEALRRARAEVPKGEFHAA